MATVTPRLPLPPGVAALAEAIKGGDPVAVRHALPSAAADLADLAAEDRRRAILIETSAELVRRGLACMP